MNFQKNLADLQFKVARTILFASALLFIPIICFDVSLGFYGIAFLKVLIIGIFGFAYYKLKKVGFQEHYAILVNVFVLGFIALNYFGNQGTEGPSLFASMALFVVYPILLSKSWKWIFLLITICAGLTLLFFGMDKSNLIQAEYESPMQQFIDHASTYGIMGIYVFILVDMVLDYYKKQNLDLAMAHEQVNFQMELLKKEKQRKENLLGILAHDVKAPINNLSQMLDLYKEDLITSQEFDELLGGIKNRLEHLNGSVNGILAQLNTEIKDESSEEYFNPVFLTQKVVNLIRNNLEHKKQKLDILYSEAIVNARVNVKIVNHISIVLKNLIDNAHKYSEDGCVITVRLKEVGGQIVWEVEDEGQGVSLEKQKKLFLSTLTSDSGSGMGLYLCQSLAESVGATITYSPKPKGSIFRLSVNL